MLDTQDLQKLPFYSWECLTIQLESRDINFVVKDAQHMDLLLKFLILNLKTSDGEKDSALPLIEKLGEVEVDKYKRLLNVA
jgi:hypothetical protein